MSWDSVYQLLRPLRLLVGLLAFTNFVIIASGMRFSNSSETTQSVYFMDFQQLLINGGLFVASVYTSSSRSTWTATYKTVAVGVLCCLSFMYAITLLIRIQSNGGCSSAAFEDKATRCIMQYVISTDEMLWAILLLMEGVITYHQSKDVEWQNKVREEEEERAQATAVHYQPDLSLSGSNNEGDTAADPISMEMEPLPAYVPRAPRDQPRIVDMYNVSEPLQAPNYYPPTSSLPLGNPVSTSESGLGSGSESGPGLGPSSGSGSGQGEGSATGSPSPTSQSTGSSTQAAGTTEPSVPQIARLPSYAP